MHDCKDNKNGNCNIDGACCVGYESAHCPKHENGCIYNIFGNCNIDGGTCIAQSYMSCSTIRKLKGEKENGK